MGTGEQETAERARCSKHPWVYGGGDAVLLPEPDELGQTQVGLQVRYQLPSGKTAEADLPFQQKAAEVVLAWFNPGKPDHGEFGAQVLADLIQQLGADLVLQPPSSKSQGMILEAARLVNRNSQRESGPVKVITFLGGEANETNLQAVKYQLLAAGVPESEWEEWIELYTPITGKKKFLAVTPSLMEQVAQAIRQKKRLVLADDVYSSGATLAAARKLLARVLQHKYDIQIEPNKIPIVTVAQEVPDGQYNDQARQKAGVTCGIVIPVLAQMPNPSR